MTRWTNDAIKTGHSGWIGNDEDYTGQDVTGAHVLDIFIYKNIVMLLSLNSYFPLDMCIYLTFVSLVYLLWTF